MPTRLKRRPIWRPLLVTTALLGVQGYLGYNAVNGQFGLLSNTQLQADIETLKATSFGLKAQIDDYKHRKSLFDPARLDPDILTEQARALLNMGSPEAFLIMVDPRTGLPLSSSPDSSTADELTPKIVVRHD